MVAGRPRSPEGLRHKGRPIACSTILTVLVAVEVFVFDDNMRLLAADPGAETGAPRLATEAATTRSAGAQAVFDGIP